MQKKRLVIITTAMMLILLSACGDSGVNANSITESVTPMPEPLPSASSSTESSKATPDVRSYTKVDFAELIDELNANALRAKKTYQDMYVELTGELSNIDNDGKYISISDPYNDLPYSESILCYITDDSQIENVLMANMGDIMTVHGQITTVGETMGYVIDMDELLLGYSSDSSNDYWAETDSGEPPSEAEFEEAVTTMVEQWLDDPNNPAGDFKDNWELINYDFSWGGDEGAETQYVLYATVRIYIRYEESYSTEDLSVTGSAWWNGYDFTSISYAT